MRFARHPPEALAHSPSQMPLSCPVAPASRRELHKDGGGGGGGGGVARRARAARAPEAKSCATSLWTGSDGPPLWQHSLSVKPIKALQFARRKSKDRNHTLRTVGSCQLLGHWQWNTVPRSCPAPRNAMATAAAGSNRLLRRVRVTRRAAAFLLPCPSFLISQNRPSELLGFHAPLNTPGAVAVAVIVAVAVQATGAPKATPNAAAPEAGHLARPKGGGSRVPQRPGLLEVLLPNHNHVRLCRNRVLRRRSDLPCSAWGLFHGRPRQRINQCLGRGLRRCVPGRGLSRRVVAIIVRVTT